MVFDTCHPRFDGKTFMIASGISIVVGLFAMMTKKKLGLLQVNPIWWVIPGAALLAYGFYQKSKCPPLTGAEQKAFPAETAHSINPYQPEQITDED